MRIAELIARHVRVPLKRTIKTATGARDISDSLVVCCRLDDGTLGWGEGLPRKSVTGETIDTAFEHIKQSDLKRQLGAPLADLAAAVRTCDALVMQPAGTDGRDCFGNAARCAVELSVLDAVTRATKVPLSTVTALHPAAMSIRKPQPRVRYSGMMMPVSAFQDWLWVRKLKRLHFQQMKLYVGLDDQHDLSMVTKLRRTLGDDVSLRIDAAGAWTAANLEAKLAPLLPHGLSAVEQPICHAEVNKLGELRKKLGVPIILDESLCSFRDAGKAMEKSTCDMFNVKLSKCGGFLPSLKLAGVSYAAGIACQLGCHAGETGILSAAGRHFAMSIADLKYVEGSHDEYFVKEPLTVENLTFEDGGFAPALTGHGLGVTIDTAAIARLTVREEHFSFS